MTEPAGPPQRWPVTPKAHGAWLGAGAGTGLALAVIDIIQAVTHQPLNPGLADAIFAASGPVLAFAGAWLAPHQARP